MHSGTRSEHDSKHLNSFVEPIQFFIQYVIVAPNARPTIISYKKILKNIFDWDLNHLLNEYAEFFIFLSYIKCWDQN